MTISYKVQETAPAECPFGSVTQHNGLLRCCGRRMTVPEFGKGSGESPNVPACPGVPSIFTSSASLLLPSEPGLTFFSFLNTLKIIFSIHKLIHEAGMKHSHGMKTHEPNHRAGAGVPNSPGATCLCRAQKLRIVSVWFLQSKEEQCLMTYKIIWDSNFRVCK